MGVRRRRSNRVGYDWRYDATQNAFNRSPLGKRLYKRTVTGGMVDTDAKQRRYDKVTAAYQKALRLFESKKRKKRSVRHAKKR